MLFLIIISGGAAAAYWYYINYMQETPKSAFFKFVGDNNFDNVLDIDLYYDMIDQLGKKSFMTETTASFTTTKENDFTQNIDSSKFDFSLKISKDRNKEKSLVDAKIDYSSNLLFDLKILNTKDAIAIASDEIFDKYIASRKDKFDESIKKTVGIETEVSANAADNTLKSISDNRIDMDSEYKASKTSEYSEEIYNLIPEEAVTLKENVIVTINSEEINTNAYTLSLDNVKCQEILKTVLGKLRNDDELLEKIVTGTTAKEQTETEIKTNSSNDVQVSPINTIPSIQTETEIIEGETVEHETELEIPSIEVAPIQNTALVDETSLETTEIPSINIDAYNTTNTEVEDIPSVSMPTFKDNYVEVKKSLNNEFYTDLIGAVVFGQKIEGTAQELKEKIDKELDNVSSIEDGITITIYVRSEEGKERETLKLVAELPEKTNLDVEYIGDSKFKITYLAPEEDEEGKEVLSGNSVEVEKQSSDVNVKYNIQYNKIENKKVKSKTQIQLQTNNSNPSKGYTNNAIIKYNDSEGDWKINIKNEIKFQEEAIEEEINDENAVFIDSLSDEEAQNLFNQIFEKVMSVYAEKLVSLTFIDNNSSNSVVQAPVIQQQVNVEEKNEIKEKLIETVSNMMGEAIARGEEFTIQNLANLSMEGYEVSTTVSTDLAIIKINGYTFNIDKDFMLSE